MLVAIALVVLCAGGAAAASGFVYGLRQVDSGPNQIHGFRIDLATGTLTLIPGFPIASGGTGTGAAVSETIKYSNSRLYVINDGDDTLSAFTVNLASGALTPMPFSPVALGLGSWGCLDVHPSGSPVVVGDGNGNISSFVVTSTTATAAAGSPYTTSGAAPFSCTFSEDGAYVYTGGNSGIGIAGYSVSVGSGVLTPLAGSPFNSGGGNPVGYATDSSGRLFTANAAANQVRVFTTAGGTPTGVAGNPFSAGGLAVAVAGVLHPSGFYMVADRGARVGVYQIAGSGSGTTLTGVSGSPFLTGGSFTDALALTTNGEFLVAANGGSRNFTVFQVNGTTGALTSVGLQPANTLGASGRVTGVTFAASEVVAGDFDGDGKSDLTVFRPSTGNWITLNSGTNYTTSATHHWGVSSDIVVPGDYDGDGKIDPAVYRPSTGAWLILHSGTNYTTSAALSWGLSTDVPVPGDYDGDGKSDPAIFRPSTGLWAILKSSTNYMTSATHTWGVSSDVPVPGDYDGDGKSDPAVYRPSTGTWLILNSSTNYTTSVAIQWGLGTDIPVPADYDGDGKTDPAVFRPSTGFWLILMSSTNYTTSAAHHWGVSSDVRVPADYNGDGKADPAVYRPSTGTWLILNSGTNYTTSTARPWGLSTDRPINKRP